MNIIPLESLDKNIINLVKQARKKRFRLYFSLGGKITAEIKPMSNQKKNLPKIQKSKKNFKGFFWDLV